MSNSHHELREMKKSSNACPLCGAENIRTPAQAVMHIRQNHPDKAADWVVNFPTDPEGGYDG